MTIGKKVEKWDSAQVTGQPRVISPYANPESLLLDTDAVQSEIAAFLADPGCVPPDYALELIQRAWTTITQLQGRIVSERARANLLYEENELMRQLFDGTGERGGIGRSND